MDRVSKLTREHRAEAVERLKLREEAHKKLDEALVMYLDGAPLWIVNDLMWSTMRVTDKLRITIMAAIQ